MRHNPGMPRLPLIAALLLLLSGGCGRVDVPLDDVGQAGTWMEFSGVRACADCDAIEASLRLEAEGPTQRYRLVERYLGDGHARRFEESGTWRARGDLLQLRRVDGGERTYLRLADGRLQARASSGRSDPRLAGDVLVPLARHPR